MVHVLKEAASVWCGIVSFIKYFFVFYSKVLVLKNNFWLFTKKYWFYYVMFNGSLKSIGFTM